MPICLIQTNLPSVPDGLQVAFSKVIAETLNKPEERISVTINSGLQMCRGGNSEPTIVVQIWSIGVFGKDKNPAHADSLFEFFKEHIPSVSQERIVLLFHPIEPHDISIRL